MANRRLMTAATVGALGAFGLGSVARADDHDEEEEREEGEGAGRIQRAAAFGGLIAAIIQDVEVLESVDVNIQDVLNNSLNRNTIEVVRLENVLNGSQINLLSDILNGSFNNSEVLTNFLNNLRAEILKNIDVNVDLRNVLNNNNIVVSDILAIDLLSGTLYVLTQ